MKPQILVLSSSSNYIALNLEKDLKERPFSRLNSLEAYISSDRRSIPFLLIMEVANGEDLDRALIAYEWAETVDPRAPARYLILASKGVAFGERTAKLATVETAFLPVNNRNLLFKVDLQLKLLEAAVAAVPAQGYGSDRPRTGFRAELASLPGRPGRVMVLRNPAQGKWQRDSVPGAKVRWRWVEDESGGSAAAGAAAPSSGVSWAADSATEPEFEKELGGYILGGEDPDLKAFRKGEEIYSARNMIFTLATEDEEEGPAGDAAREAGPTRESAAPIDAAASFPPGAEKPATTPQTIGAPSERRAGEVELDLSRGPLKQEAPRLNLESEAPGVAPAKTFPVAGGKPEKPSGGVAAVLRAAQAARDAPARRADSAPAPGVSENKTYLPEVPRPAEPGSISAASAAHDAVDLREKARVEKEGPAAEQPSERMAHLEETGGSTRRLAEIPPTARSEEEKTLGASVSPAAGIPVPSRSAGSPAPDEERVLEEKFRASAFEPTLKLGSVAEARREETASPKKSPSAPSAGGGSGEASPPPPAASPNVLAGSQSPGEAPPAAPGARADAAPPSAEEPSRLSASERPAADGLQISRARTANSEFQARILKDQANEGEEHRVRAAREAEELSRIAAQVSARSDEERLSGAARGKEEGEPVAERLSYQMTLTELGDQNSTWQPASTYRIYLSARHRYYGFRHETELFPLWVYQGELAPEFLEAEKAWRFYDRRPEPYFTRAELPASLSSELFRLVPAAGPAAGEAPAEAGAAPSAVLWKTGETPSPKGVAAPPPKGFFSSLLAFVRKLLGS